MPKPSEFYNDYHLPNFHTSNLSKEHGILIPCLPRMCIYVLCEVTQTNQIPKSPVVQVVLTNKLQSLRNGCRLLGVVDSGSQGLKKEKSLKLRNLQFTRALEEACFVFYVFTSSHWPWLSIGDMPVFNKRRSSNLSVYSWQFKLVQEIIGNQATTNRWLPALLKPTNLAWNKL